MHERYRSEHDDHATSIDVLGGRRLRFDTLSLALVAGGGVKAEDGVGLRRPSPPHRRAHIVARMMKLGSPIPPPAGSQTNTRPEAIVKIRLNFRTTSLLRSFVSLDGASGQSWSLGLTLGAAVGT